MSLDSQNKKDTLRGVFTRSASSYERIRYFPIFGEWLVEMAQIPEGATILDVACGRGAVLFPAAERVGPRGHMTGIDLADGMARETEGEIERRELKQAEARQMDADLRETYGAVVKLGSQSLDKPDEIQRWFSRAGFVDVQISSKEVDMIYLNAEEWWNNQWSLSGRAGLEKLSPEALEQFKSEAFEKAQAQKQAGGFHYRLEAFCTTAKKM